MPLQAILQLIVLILCKTFFFVRRIQDGSFKVNIISNECLALNESLCLFSSLSAIWKSQLHIQ